MVRKAGAGIMKGANKVTDVVGARDLSNYAAGKMAKAMVPKEARKYVQDDTSGKAALKSAGKLGLSIASVASVAGAARGAGALATRSAAKKAVAKKAATKAKLESAKLTAWGKEPLTKNAIGKAKDMDRAILKFGKGPSSSSPTGKSIARHYDKKSAVEAKKKSQLLRDKLATRRRLAEERLSLANEEKYKVRNRRNAARARKEAREAKEEADSPQPF